MREIRFFMNGLCKLMQESNSISSNRLDVNLSEEFTEELLIFAPNRKRCWWRVNEVFWENEGIIFEDDRGYLKAYYPETLKPFFTALGISERAARWIMSLVLRKLHLQEKRKIPTFVNVLNVFTVAYGSLCKKEALGRNEKWKQTREVAIGSEKKGNEWSFFSRRELVYNDHHEYIAEILKESAILAV